HCHLESEEFADSLESVLDAARLAGVAALVTCSIVPEQWAVSRALAGRFPEVYCALGVHPWYAREEHLSALDGLRDARGLGAVAIGEIGLDRKIEAPPFAFQRKVFETQLGIANEIGLPVIVHCRGAFNELIESVKAVGPPKAGGVVHAFSGSVEVAEELMPLGFSFSMGGTLTYRNSKKRHRTLKRIYPGHFLFETDSPDIPPVEARGVPNTPANILYALRAAVEILEEPAEAIAEATTRNAVRLFGLEV
ncbi:MAG: TatD family hydrolase, partial [Candidatus Hydrogenedentes bacterium]|nr:TatD family hydrolase [Candidatus Hydrogenedentota bacterium]